MTKEEVFGQNIGLTTIIAYLTIYISFCFGSGLRKRNLAIQQIDERK